MNSEMDDEIRHCLYDIEELGMADPRLPAHQQFDLVRCKLCNKLYDDPRLLDCLHSFCTGCLATYITIEKDDVVKCPTCQEPIILPTDGIQGIMHNTLLKRFINQAQKDKTSVVAGREVLQMSQEALTESELKCPEIVASVQEIAQTAGHVLADNLEHTDIKNDTESMIARQSVQLKMSELQMKVMDIVHCIDRVNQGLHDWQHRRTQTRNAVKQRSLQLQDGIRSIERRLLAQLEDRDTVSEMKDEAFKVKNKLHKTLRTSLGLVDFLRLVSEFGNCEELNKYGAMATGREEKLYNKKIYMTENQYTFDHPSLDLAESLEMMFGTLSEVTEETVAWDPFKMTYQSEQEKVQDAPLYSEFSDMHQRNNPKLNYTEINEIGIQNSAVASNNDMSDKISKRQLATGSVRANRRPMKSMSFDETLPPSPYHYIKSENQDLQHEMLRAHEPDIQTQFQVLNEQASVDQANQHNSMGHNSVRSAINSLEQSSKFNSPLGHRSRRLSAPPSLLIDSLNRRKLSALSILERANINTEGLHVSSDIESGMNEARMEWLRENVRKKAERKTSEEESV